MRKISRIGTIDTGNGRRASVYIEAEIKEDKLSIRGCIGPLPSGNALGGCGQIDMEFAHRNQADNDKRYNNLIRPSQINFAPNWDADLWLDLLDIWGKWHLNDMKAGTPEQELAIKDWKAQGNEYDYTKACEYLKSIGLYEVPIAPKQYNDSVSRIPETTYKYGTAWLKVELPQGVIDFIASLPDTDKQPAWV